MMFLTGKNLSHIKSVLQYRPTYSVLRYFKSCTSTTSRFDTPFLCAVHTCSLNGNITVQNSLPFMPHCYVGNRKILTLPWFQISTCSWSPEQRNFSTSKITLCQKSTHKSYIAEADEGQQKKTKWKQRKISKNENLKSKEFETKEADTQRTEEKSKTFVPKEQDAQQREEASKNLRPKEESKQQTKERKKFVSDKANTLQTREESKKFVPRGANTLQTREESKKFVLKKANTQPTEESKKFVPGGANTRQTEEKIEFESRGAYPQQTEERTKFEPRGAKTQRTDERIEFEPRGANTQQTGEESKKFVLKKANTQHADDMKKFVPRGASTRQIEENIEFESRGSNTQHTDERKKFEPRAANTQQTDEMIEFERRGANTQQTEKSKKFVSRGANTRQTKDGIEFVSREANTQQTEKSKNILQTLDDLWQAEERKKRGVDTQQTGKSKRFAPIVENTWQTEERRKKSSKMSTELKNEEKVDVKENLQEIGGKILEKKSNGDNYTINTLSDRYAYHSECDWGLKDIYQKIIDLDKEGKISLDESAKDRVLSLMGRIHDVKLSYGNLKRAAEEFMHEESTLSYKKTFRNNKSRSFRRKYSTLVGESGTEEFPEDRTSIAEHSTPNLKDEEIEDYFGEGQELEEVTTWEPPIAMIRGKTGVYDVDQLVALLKEQKAKDVCVIKMPRHLQLSDYMVIATGKSPRQSVAIMATVQYMYKQKKVPNDLYPKFERDQKDWLTVDLGNIILHVMSEESRKYYNLETLWTVGEEFDDNFMDDDEDNVYNLTDSDLEWLKEYDVNNPQNNKKE